MNNKKGVKLLAAVLVFAMAFAGAFIIVSDDSDAAIDGSDHTYDSDSAIDTDAEAAYDVITVNKAGGTVVLSIEKDFTEATVSIYVTQTTTLELKFKNGVDQDGSIVIYSANGDVDGAVTNSGVTIASAKGGDDYSIVYKSHASAPKVSGNIEATVSGTASSIVEVDTDDGLTVKGNWPTNTVKAASIIFDNETKISTYRTASADLGSIEITTNDVIVIAAGSAIISQGENVVTIKNADIETFGNAIKVVGAGTNALPAISGTLAGTNAEITISSGAFDGTTALGGTTLNLVQIAASSGTATTYASQIPATNPTGVTTITGYTVKGTVTQKVSVETSGTVSVSAGSTFIINEGINLNTGATTSAGATAYLKVFGNFDSNITKTNFVVYVGPSGYIHNDTTEIKADNTTNVKTNNDTSISGDVTSSTLGTGIIAADGTLTIPAGKTVTLEGDLGLNGRTLYVNGTLVIAKGSSIFGTAAAAEKIVLGTNGKIENNGTMSAYYAVVIEHHTTSANKVTLAGVSGAEFGYKSGTLYVTGDIIALRNTTQTPSVTVAGAAAIMGTVTIGKGVTLTDAANINILKGSSVTVNGTLTGTYTVGELAELTINGTLSNGAVIKVLTGTYNTSDNTLNSTRPTVALTVNSTGVTGFTVYGKRVATLGSDGNYSYTLEAFINGNMKSISTSNATIEMNKSGSTGTADLNIAADEELVIAKTVALTVTTGTINVSGQLVNIDETAGTPGISRYNGAFYQITPTEAGSDTTGYYTTVEAAMAAIETADDKSVTIKIGTLVNNITVKAGQSVNITATGIDKDAVFTAEDESEVSGTISSVDGMVIIAGDASSTLSVSGAASEKTGSDGTKTYAGFLVAVNNASAGDVINIGSATVGGENNRESLVIPAGVKVIVSNMLTINGNLTIPATAELIGGIISISGESPSEPATVDVAGKLDLSEGALAGTNNKITSSGEVITQSLGTNMNGAYYINNDGKYVLTNVANAIAFAKANGINVNIMGTYVDMSDITVDGANITIDNGAKVTLGKVILVQKKITATGDLTATITAKCGSDETTGAVSDATLEVVKSSAIIESKKVTSAAGVTTYTFKIDKIDGEMKVTQGTVTTSAIITSIATGSKFTVASGATFAVVNNVTIDGDDVAFVVDGTMTVNTAIVTLSEVTTGTGKAPVINGTLDIQKNGTVNASSLVVLGDVNIVNTETETGTFTVDTTAVQIGAPMETLGAGASVTGPMSIASAKYLIVYSGADMSKALINVTAGVSGAKTTEFYVNDVLYATVYNNGNTTDIWTSTSNYAVGAYNIITPAMLNEIIGVDDFTYDDKNPLIWRDVDGNKVAGKDVGEISALYATMNVSNANIMISVGEGISLYVDGVRISVSGTTAPIAVGEHTVKAIVDPGYKGATTITFNGATVSNGKIVVTADMVGAAKAPVLSVTGEITIDTGSTPAPVEKDDSGMGITDYLLIVLVILAAILVVVVAIRMMRS